MSVTTRPVCDRLSDDRGAAEGFILIMLVAILAFAGLSYDAGMALNARREATNLALASARSGTDTVSKKALLNEGRALLDESQARDDALTFAQAQGAETVAVDVLNEIALEVTITRTHETTFLGIVGLSEITVSGTARSNVRSVGDEHDLP